MEKENSAKQFKSIEEDDIIYPIQVHLDNIDKRILAIFEKNPLKGWRVNQILPILIDSGYQMSYALLTRRLDVLCTLTILEKRRENGKVFRYYSP